MSLCHLLNGELDYSESSTPYSERESHLSIVDNGRVGLGKCQLSYLNDTQLLTSHWMDFEVLDGGDTADGIWAWSSRHLPYGILYSGISAELMGRAVVSFIDSDTAWFGLELSNRGEHPVTFQVRGVSKWDEVMGLAQTARWRPELNIWEVTGHLDQLDGTNLPQLIKVFQNVRFDPLPEAIEVFPLDQPLDLVHGTSIAEEPGITHFHLKWPKVTLGPGETWQVRLQWGVSYNDQALSAIRVTAGWMNILDVTETLRQGREQWDYIFERVNKPENLDEGRLSLFLHAFVNLMRTLVAPRGMFGTHRGAYPAKGYAAAHSLWDACFMALGLGEMSYTLAEDMLLIFFENQLADGSLPLFVTQTWSPETGECLPPLIGWSSWRLYQRFQRKEFIEQVYPHLVKYNEWWDTHALDTETGLYIASPTFAAKTPTTPCVGVRGEAPTAVVPVFINSCMLVQRRVLGWIAAELGLDEEATRWAREADQLGTIMLDRLWDPTDEVFYDYLPDESRFRKRLTPGSFLPLWAGVQLPEQQAKQVIQQWLTNPDTCFGKIPFPSLSYADTEYSSSTPWEGAFWFIDGYWMIETLLKYGFEAEAAEAEDRMVTAAMQNPLIYAWYDSKTGRGVGNPEYAAVSALLIEMLLHRYNESG